MMPNWDCDWSSHIISEALIVGKYYRRVNASCEHPTPRGIVESVYRKVVNSGCYLVRLLLLSYSYMV